MKEFFTRFGNAVRAHKGRTIAISVAAFVLICAVVTLSCLGVYVFNRFATGYVPMDEQLAVINGDVANQYDRVVIFGIDGAGAYPKAMLDDDPASLPNFKKLFVDGTTANGGTKLNASYTYTGVAVYPTISAQNWTSMFHGVRPTYHGITGSTSNSDLDAGKKANEKYPSFVKQFVDQKEGKVISSCTWSAINNGAIEDLDESRVIKMNTNCQTLLDIKDGKEVIGDDALTTQIKETIDDRMEGSADVDYALRDRVTVQRIIDATTTETGRSDYKIIYMHLNQVDSAGHSFGYNRQPYAAALSHIDALIGKLYNAYDALGMADNTLFIFCTDHGHRYPQNGTGHGGNSAVEVNVTFAISGKTVKAGTPGKYVNTDLAPIVAYALGVKAADTWQGRVPYNMFTLLG